jgi:predicted lipoprotein with Yx(FWY)xxD motif
VTGGTLGKRVALGAAALAFAAGVAGCDRAIPSSNGGPTTVSADQSDIGIYLEDQSGHALYLFEGDDKGESYCNNACASVWPPYETNGQPMAGSGVNQSDLGTITRDDGTTQITFKDEPLYYYAGDGSKPDETNGEGIAQFGAEWYLVSPKNGAPVEAQSGGSSGGGS